MFLPLTHSETVFSLLFFSPLLKAKDFQSAVCGSMVNVETVQSIQVFNYKFHCNCNLSFASVHSKKNVSVTDWCAVCGVYGFIYFFKWNFSWKIWRLLFNCSGLTKNKKKTTFLSFENRFRCLNHDFLNDSTTFYIYWYQESKIRITKKKSKKILSKAIRYFMKF